ncbi:electron transfer flavoprotein subunit alpha/FixB family protein [Arthrobacter globiformis]|uniref:Electron transfer flavoprotein alpha/beta-subunit N-terminal domain-containing protein n=1 Tax=Arthrobacter globiformis TaxID=1665 RepID=A0A328HAP9_ARTGO|nr:electron transfer flavoprotein subunit alpha/FixB family protein [Arthrobacter globiformis]RAM35652.1 hypothetical protein DBZ45_19400 [Arthrobacter globiformis]
MTKILVLGECTDGTLTDATRELITAASSLGGAVTLGIVAGSTGDVQVSVTGVDTLAATVIPSGSLDAESRCQACDALIAAIRPDVILMSFTITTASFAAAIAEARNLAFASDIIGLSYDENGGLIARKTVYGGQVVAELAFPTDEPKLLLTRQGVWEPAPDGGQPSRSIDIDVSIDSYIEPRVRHVEFIEPESAGDLKNAEVIFSIGRGIGGRDNIEEFATLAETAGAALGASRPVIDAGWLPTGHQVGQTGTSVKPRVYVAFGISGAQQHLAGITGAKTIVAVNSDAAAPIFGVADYGAVEDIFEVARELKVLLSTSGSVR